MFLEPVPLYFAKILLILKSTKEFGRFLKRGQTLIISTTPRPSFQKEGKTYFLRPDSSKRPLVERGRLSASAGSATVNATNYFFRARMKVERVVTTLRRENHMAV